MHDNDGAVDAYVEVAQRPPEQPLFGRAILDWVLATSPGEPAVHLGDLLDMSCKSEMRRMRSLVKAARPPTAILPGNHDGLMFGIFNQPLATATLEKALNPWYRGCLRGTLESGDGAKQDIRDAAVDKRGSVAYENSKAADNHLVRELAIELAPLVRVNGLAPATVVEGSSMFPRERVLSSLHKYNVPHDESDSTEHLREQLAQFYAQRTLTRQPVTLADQAEVAYLLSSSKFAKTTGQIIGVDGGLPEAFLR